MGSLKIQGPLYFGLYLAALKLLSQLYGEDKIISS